MITEDTKKCNKCDVVKPWNEFYLKQKSGRPTSKCKECSRDPTKPRKKPRAGSKTRGPKGAKVTVKEYFSMSQRQKDVCAICLQPCTSGRFLAVDHDHDNGQIRGLLCTRCNIGLGQFQDSIEILCSAVRYLRKYKTEGI